jgi:hypothetical protein
VNTSEYSSPDLITPGSSPTDVIRMLARPGGMLPDEADQWPNVRHAFRDAMRSAIAKIPSYPRGRFKGRGIVIAGGGRYFASLYVTLRMIRNFGSRLPVEVWYFGKRKELSQWQQRILHDLGATCVDADAVAVARGGVRILNGWELKAFSVLNSSFEQVRYQDADSYPCRDPDFLFENRDFRRYGSLFFPDAPWMDLVPEVWETLGIPYRHEPTFESGQFLIDKSLAWEPILLASWMNQRSDFYYRIGPRKVIPVGKFQGHGLYGDKDTWHLAFRYLGREYGITPRAYEWIIPAMVHFGPDGPPIFVHRARKKFTLDEAKFPATLQDGPDFEPQLPMESQAHDFLNELRAIAPPECYDAVHTTFQKPPKFTTS